MAILYALKALCKDKNSLHVQILTDNTSAVAHINNMGGIKSDDLNSLPKDIWNWCCDKNIWLTAAHIPGKCNPADIESGVFNDNVEWMLDSNVFLQLAKLWGKPTMDLFASRLNCQISKFASWKPDHDAVVIDAFSSKKYIKCAQTPLISTFLLPSLGRYICWWTNRNRWYSSPISQCFCLEIVY